MRPQAPEPHELVPNINSDLSRLRILGTRSVFVLMKGFKLLNGLLKKRSNLYFHITIITVFASITSKMSAMFSEKVREVKLLNGYINSNICTVANAYSERFQFHWRIEKSTRGNVYHHLVRQYFHIAKSSSVYVHMSESQKVDIICLKKFYEKKSYTIY